MTDDDKTLLRNSVRDYLARHATEERVRELMETDSGFDETMWQTMATELGLLGVAVPEEYGGSDGTLSDLIVVAEEMGARVVGGPFFSTVALAIPALLASEDSALCERLLRPIVDGEIVATVAVADARWCEPTPSAAVGQAPETTVTMSADGPRLNGMARQVLDGHVADIILVPAREEGGTSLFLVRRSAEGLSARVLPTLDRTRKQAAITMVDTPAERVGDPGSAPRTLRQTMQTALIVLAAEQLGGARWAFDTAVAYAKLRVQFGRTIGSFQTIKHRCADLAVDLEAAQSAVQYAGSLSPTDATRDLVASVAKSVCSDAFVRTVAENIQIHGGIGFTWEHPAHLYLRRAKTSELLFGTPAQHREIIAAHLGLGPSSAEVTASTVDRGVA